jgi:hypothetical protein
MLIGHQGNVLQGLCWARGWQSQTFEYKQQQARRTPRKGTLLILDSDYTEIWERMAELKLSEPAFVRVWMISIIVVHVDFKLLNVDWEIKAALQLLENVWRLYQSKFVLLRVIATDVVDVDREASE